MAKRGLCRWGPQRASLEDKERRCSPGAVMAQGLGSLEGVKHGTGPGWPLKPAMNSMGAGQRQWGLRSSRSPGVNFTGTPSVTGPAKPRKGCPGKEGGTCPPPGTVERRPWSVLGGWTSPGAGPLCLGWAISPGPWKGLRTLPVGVFQHRRGQGAESPGSPDPVEAG